MVPVRTPDVRALWRVGAGMLTKSRGFFLFFIIFPNGRPDPVADMPCLDFRIPVADRRGRLRTICFLFCFLLCIFCRLCNEKVGFIRAEIDDQWQEPPADCFKFLKTLLWNSRRNIDAGELLGPHGCHFPEPHKGVPDGRTADMQAHSLQDFCTFCDRKKPQLGILRIDIVF